MIRHYDVVVLGGSLGALSAAALLSRRSFRVLLLGQGFRPSVYRHEGLPLLRRPSTFLGGGSPAWERITGEVASSPLVARRGAGDSEGPKLLLPSARLALRPGLAGFADDLERVFPTLRRAADLLTQEAAEQWAALEALFRDDVVWRGGTFWEARKARKVRKAWEAATTKGGPSFLADLPEGHEVARAFQEAVAFASYLKDPGLSIYLRSLTLWSRQARGPDRSEEELVTALVERITTLGGDVRMADRASRIVRARRRVSGVAIDGEELAVGCEFVISDVGVRGLLDLASDFEPSPERMSELPDLWTVAHRFVVSILVREVAIPELAASEMIFVGRLPEGGGRGAKSIHIERARVSGLPEGCVLLVVECLLEGTLENELEDARERVLASVEQAFPFIARHYRLVDSPNDGRPLWDYRSGARVEVERAVLRKAGGAVDAEPMAARFRVAKNDWSEFDDTVGDPIRTPLPGALAIGPRALPGFGQEGELMAALSAAHVITKSDPGRERIRRAVWRRTDVR